jgi:gamma-glutamyltranspeptidase/glutathione hydrolase
MVVPPGVAAGHPATVEMGIRTLERGGTAADAAVAATLGACVAESIFTGLGGGGFATYYEAATKRVTCLDFFCAAPGLDGDADAGPMRPIAVQFGEVPLPYSIGGSSVAVPGVAAGCGEIHARWGRLPWADVVEPVAQLAKVGVTIPNAHAATLPALLEAMMLDQGAAAYTPHGVPLGPGDRLYHEGLADTLHLLAQEGPDVLYTGELGSLMIDAVRADGGSLGPADLKFYRVIERDYVEARLDGCTVFGRHDLNQTLATLRTLPPLTGMDVTERAVILAKALGPSVFDGYGETTNITVVDAEGNACVVTTTLGLGAGIWIPRAGVHLNSMLGEGELNTGEQSPGDRIASMMCPLVALDEHGDLVLAAGSAGASRIRSALLVTLIAALVDGKKVEEAVATPRLHTVDDLVHIEPKFAQAEEQALLHAGFRVKRWSQTNHYFGGVSAIGVTGASGDPRRDGASALL